MARDLFELFLVFGFGIRVDVQVAHREKINKVEHSFTKLLLTNGSKANNRVDKSEFITKYGIYSYKGNILDYMSEVDLSCNHLTGKIPIEVGKLSNIHALNLSHNNLTGSIPTTFSHLRQIESLDLSYDNLNGRIPQLSELSNLEVFNVAHNNLSSPTQEQKAQFATFEESSYEGNSFLCRLPLLTNRIRTIPISEALDKDEHDGFIDIKVFYVSFLVSYIC
ncbi:hypothetical protein HYC85_015766 [Camellia sinensis]|uniref:Uncharacterized protein n=1 Tax=Camellia sinensis TaxID=4442 RepID=A0A7J7H1K0_CAMSI|nr:hypothetical protein HYC85_015766 [Camellia sinensis]